MCLDVSFQPELYIFAPHSGLSLSPLTFFCTSCVERWLDVQWSSYISFHCHAILLLFLECLSTVYMPISSRFLTWRKLFEEAKYGNHSAVFKDNFISKNIMSCFHFLTISSYQYSSPDKVPMSHPLIQYDTLPDPSHSKARRLVKLPSNIHHKWNNQ
jgi:hypothetical protein